MFNNKPGGSIFSNSNQGQTNMFSNQQQGGSLFNQGQQTGGLFNQGQGNQSTNLFGNAQRGSSNLFGNAQGSTSNNMFNNTGGSTNLFGQNTQGGGSIFSNQSGGYNQQGSFVGTGAPNQFSQVNEAQLYNLLTAPEDQQRKLFEAFSGDYIKQLIALYRKNLDSTKVDRLQIGGDNPLRNEKLTKVATSLNIKPQLIQLKKLIRDNVSTKLKGLKKDKEKMQNLSLDFSAKVYDKLQKYKEKLVLSVTQNKMIDEIKKEVDDLDQQIKQFFKPLFNAHQNRTNYSFVDPDPFCLAVSERLLKNMTVLDNKMDEFLACQTEQTEQNISTADVIVQLVEYYQNVAVTLKEFAEKYNKLKHRIVQRNSQVNSGDVLRKITEKANSAVSKEMQTYELVKEIEAVLKKRQGKVQDRTSS